MNCTQALVLLIFVCGGLWNQEASAVPQKASAKRNPHEKITSDKLPDDALKLLQLLPEKQITLDLVVGLGVLSSDSFRAVAADEATIDLPYYESRAPLDPQLFVKSGWMKDQTEPLSPFSPTETKSFSSSIGAQARFLTGTSLVAELSHGNTDLLFSTGLLARYETKLSLSLQQSLLKDAFGRDTRRALRAGDLLREAAQASFSAQQEDWLHQLVSFYYQVWLAQAQARASAQGLERRSRLLEITRIKFRRGTAETPDLLQIQGSHVQAQTELSQAQQKLSEIWRLLVTTLKFPNQWLNLNPAFIPMKLDQPVEQTLGLCGPATRINEAPAESNTSRAATLRSEASTLQAEKNEHALLPDIKAHATVTSNGVDSSRNPTWGESFSGDHPAWVIGVELSMPLFREAEKAQWHASRAQSDKHRALSSQASDALRVDWVNACSDLHRLHALVAILQKSQKDQQERARLEQQRFQIARVTPLAVIQAEDDSTRAELELYSIEAQERLAAWKVQRLKGLTLEYLKDVSQKARVLSERFQ